MEKQFQAKMGKKTKATRVASTSSSHTDVELEQNPVAPNKQEGSLSCRYLGNVSLVFNVTFLKLSDKRFDVTRIQVMKSGSEVPLEFAVQRMGELKVKRLVHKTFREHRMVDRFTTVMFSCFGSGSVCEG